jgi:hypothetical protein
MTMTALLPQQPVQIQQWKSPSQIKQRIEAIQQLMTTVLKKDTDFGIIPGMPKGTKPSLWKPGSEQILAMFQIAVDPVVEDLSVDDCYRYRVTTRLTNVLTGEFLGAGIGEASTDETKYKWKKCWSNAEFEATDPDRRRMKFSTYQNETKEEMQIRQEPADLANTILKMAKKRSQIDATLTVTGASSMFEQDLEDLPEDARQQIAGQRTSKAAQKAAGGVPGDALCSECRAIGGHLPACKFSKPKQEPKPEEAVVLHKIACLILDVREMATAKKVAYLLLEIQTPDNAKTTLFVWHKSLHEPLKGAKGKNMSCDVSIRSTETKTFTQLETIYDIDGVPFVKPE